MNEAESQALLIAQKSALDRFGQVIADCSSTLVKPASTNTLWLSRSVGAWPGEKMMNAVLLKSGQIVGTLGILVMLIAVLSRLVGSYTLGGYATATLLLAGIGAVSAGCFLLLWAIAVRAQG